MSLINDALKKAQRDRESAGQGEKRPAPVGIGPRPGNPAATRSFRWTRRIVALTLVIAGTTSTVIFLLTLIDPEPVPEAPLPSEVAVHIKLADPRTEQAADKGSVPTQAERPSVAATETTPDAAAAEGTETAIAFKIPEDAPTEAPAPPAAEQAPAPTPPAETSAPDTAVAVNEAADSVSPSSDKTPPASPAPAAQPQPTATTPVTAAPQPVSEEPAPIAFAMPDQPVSVAGTADVEEEAAQTEADEQTGDPAIVAFLNASRITGVKVAGKQSRVLMNNQVFFIGSVVDPQSRLRIKAIKNNEIEFVDESGLEYRKRFQR
ncbi:hypothetical protein [Ruficoccus sp. ZRK36]|uniref:hypothetical protein n=1 Tax=Ruficoccus sp. ZRK36 TaxID=2866311 RepID=UPI001C73BF73|nr:hypothetical protein [Ruficoccus sp. ZRK36]QYY36549.1 hypothetical protein K0V07_03540 [Ruficoccus sp. ZRK36]